MRAFIFKDTLAGAVLAGLIGAASNAPALLSSNDQLLHRTFLRITSDGPVSIPLARSSNQLPDMTPDL
jgi:hypothetical protein